MYIMCSKTPDYFLDKADYFKWSSGLICEDIPNDCCPTISESCIKPNIKRYYNASNKHWYTIDWIFGSCKKPPYCNPCCPDPCVKPCCDPFPKSCCHDPCVKPCCPDPCIKPCCDDPCIKPCCNDPCSSTKYDNKKICQDKCTGDYYQINKYYDECCNPHLCYQKLCYSPTKKPWDDYYVPNYTDCSKLKNSI